MDDDYACKCAKGFYGIQCEEEVPTIATIGPEIDYCAGDPCDHGGVCYSILSGEYVCVCASGWTGRNCTEGVCLLYIII